MTPEKIGKYQILDIIGRGSMGVVYKAKDSEIDRIVALKTLKNSFLDGDSVGKEAIDRFKNELRSAGRLNHPRIVTIFDAGKDDSGTPFLVMEYVDGEGLDQLIQKKGKLEEREVCHMVAQLAVALDYAHRQAIVHRDIKPSNIIIDKNGDAHLMDFGIAKYEDTSITPAGMVVGTPSYMSPEQVKGDKLTGASDQFSLSVVAFELLVGKRPFSGNDFISVVTNIIHKDPLSVSDFGFKNNIQKIDDVFAKALSKDGEERYKTCFDFAFALSSSLSFDVDGNGIIGGNTRDKLKNDVKEIRSNKPTVQLSNIQDIVGSTELDDRTLAVLSQFGTPNLDQKSQADSSSKIKIKNNWDNKDKPKKKQRSSFPVFLIGGGLILGGAVFIGYKSIYGTFPIKLPFSNSNTSNNAATNNVVLDKEPVQVNNEVVPFNTDRIILTARAPSLPVGKLQQEQVATLKNSELLWLLTKGELPVDELKLVIAEGGTRTNETLLGSLIGLGLHKDFVVRVEVLKALTNSSEKNSPQVIDALIRALNDDEYLVRGFAVKSLLKIRTPEAVAAMQRRVAIEDNQVVKQLLSSAGISTP